MHINVNVTKRKPFYSELPEKTGYTARDYHDDKLAELAIATEAAAHKKQEVAKAKNILESEMAAYHRGMKDRIYIADEHATRVKRMIARTVVENLLLESLVIDKGEVATHEEGIRDLVKEYDNDCPIIDRIARAVATEPVPVLDTIKEGCEKIAARVVKEALESSDEPLEVFEEPNRNDFRSDIEDIEEEAGTSEISEVIKNKVVDVIQEEKAIEAREEEIQQQIEQDLMDNDEVRDDETLQEAYSRIVLPIRPIKDKSLFRALIENAYMVALKENVYNNPPRKSDDGQDVDVAQTASEYADDQTMDSHIDDAQQDAVIDMDAVMANAVVEYTLLEVLNTLRIEKYTTNKIKKLIESLSIRR